MAQYAEQLSDGQKALFKLYPSTYKMPVYPSHRDFRFADSVCQASRENAKVARLVDDGEGVVGNCALTHAPQLVPDTRLDPRYVIDHAHYLSELAVPINNGTRLLGVIDTG